VLADFGRPRSARIETMDFNCFGVSGPRGMGFLSHPCRYGRVAVMRTLMPMFAAASIRRSSR
jgi:hypothetical protein